ncbi:hypothetical protein [Rhizobium deserti]|uniref:hypothetical protein n=1 Tax=Rhizobium deserti TaxID=2547961 RepID=UPI001059EE86|nr:hypothetical protein [Rhizobium deserti]
MQSRLIGREFPSLWSSYSELWEEGDTEETGEAEHSFGALLSALVHVELQQASDPSAEVRSDALSTAVRKGMTYASGLISQDLQPSRIPPHLVEAGTGLTRLHREARSRLAYERLAYSQVARSSAKLQLAIHLAGSRRKTLVDAILFSEILFTGAMKHFSRSDPTTFTGRGYALQALHRPALKGTGNDITISTNPASSLDLWALWAELERLEDERWRSFADTPGGFKRPRGNDGDRALVSHDENIGSAMACHQPWWDDKGKRTLIAAPRSVLHDGASFPGSLLTWGDVKAAMWRCYAPTMGLRVSDRKDRATAIKLSDSSANVRALATPLVYGSDTTIIDCVRMPSQGDDAIIWSPTLSAMFAAMLATGEISIDTLPDTSDFDVIEARGGTMIISKHGVALIELSQTSDFPHRELRRAASDVATVVGFARDLERSLQSEIRQLALVSAANENGRSKRSALRAIYSAKLKARDIWERSSRVETDSLVRQFRECCEARWQGRAQLDMVISELEELERMIVSTSELRANALLNKVAIYGLPASLAGNLLGGLLLIGEKGEFNGVAFAVALAYAGSTVAGVAFLFWLVRREASSWRMD